MAETCCAEENEINYQIDRLGGFVKEKVKENRIRRMFIKIAMVLTLEILLIYSLM